VQLSESDQQKIGEWLNERCGSLRCFCCGMTSWVTGGAYLNVGYDPATAKVNYHEGIPHVSIVCANCGYIMSFSTAVMGLTPITEAQNEEE
jgi:hypothetical protein